VAAAYAAASPDDRAALDAGLGDPGLDLAGVHRLREIIRDTGALARAEERITVLTETALTALAGADVTAEARTVLTALAEAATKREL
jgi:geranylgeranyl diphosphate synthase type I